MKVNIYYGGRGLIEDPTLYVINKLIDVLSEIRVDVNRYNLYEDKNAITMLPKTLKEADAVILATTVEWLGIGGYMQQFLDACWLYGDKEQIGKLYMLPVVTASTYGERDAMETLIKAWEILGGKVSEGICAYVDDHVEFETNSEYGVLIEKKAEHLYRTVNQKTKVLPSSNNMVKKSILRYNSMDLTPQESEQLSIYVSDDTYVKKQKEDIEELSQLFKDMLGGKDPSTESEFIKEIKGSFKPTDDFAGTYSITLSDLNKTIIIEIENELIRCYYGEKEEADVLAKLNSDLLRKIVKGKVTFQQAFMAGDLTAKGNFKILRTFDQLFEF
jgi:multimeric flavodoxin WrbA/putative sterol carrier protein